MTTSPNLPHDEIERLAALKNYEILNTAPEEHFDRIARVAAKQFEASIGLVCLVGSTQLEFKAAFGTEATGADRGGSFCSYTILQDEVMCVADASDDSRFACHPFVTEGHKVRFYAGAPLIDSNGYKLGTLCLLDDKPRHEFSEIDKARLTDLASIAAASIEMRGVAADARNQFESRIKAENSLDLVEHQLGLFFEHVPISVAMLDKDLQYIAASKQWRDTFKLGDQDIVGKRHNILMSNLPGNWAQQWQRGLDGETITFEEDKMPTGETGFRWVRRHIQPWCHKDGTIGGIIISIEDIDDQKQASIELEQSRHFLEAVLENIQEGIVACDAQGALSIFNTASREFHGLERAPIRPEEWANHYDLYEADGITPLRKERIPLYRALMGELVESQEIVIAAKGHARRQIVATASQMLDSDNKLLGAVVSMQDVTKERIAEAGWRDAEARYGAIFHHSFQLCSLLDQDGIVLEINDTAIDFLGLERDQLVGRHLADNDCWQFDEATVIRLQDAWNRAKHGEFVRYELQIQAQNGHKVPIDFSIKPVSDNSGNIIRFIAEGRDISDKKESETLLKLVTDNLPFLVTYIDLDLKFRFVNQTGAEWYNLPAGSVVNKDAAEVLDRQQLLGLKKNLAQMKLGNDVTIEREIAYPDGKTRNVQVIYSAECDLAGEIRGVIVIAIDITDRKLAENQLKRNKSELELILNNVPMRIFYKDDNNTILRLNEPAAQSMGMSVADAEGRNTFDLFPEFAQKYLDDDLEVITSGEATLGIVEEYTPKDGPRGWCRTDKVPYTDPATGEQFIFVASSDITAEMKTTNALRTSEERYRMLYNNTPVMLHSVDPHGSLLSVSDFWLEKLEYSREDVIGCDAASFFSKDSRKILSEKTHPAFVQSGFCKNIDVQMVSKSGKTIDVLLNAIAECDDNGVFSKSLAVITDITDRKAIERKFVQAQKMETVGQLTGGLAHDFNNLLGVVLGNLQLIERSVSQDPKAVKRVTAALSAVDKGAELTRRLLAFSRRQKLETEAVEINPLIENVCTMLKRTLGGAVTLECCLGREISIIETDTNQLESALINLAINARDAMPNGGSLTVESSNITLDEEYAARESEVSPGDYVVIAITDTGCGIAPDQIDKIFDPFFTTKDVGKGSGLGLSMVYGFINQTGGHIRVYSELGRGTTLRLFLPAAAKKPELAVVAEEKIVEHHTGHETILVVEDQTEVREIAIALLEDLGFTTIEAENGVHALDFIHSRPDIDLMFTDIVMPGGLGGTELAKATTKIRPELPIVFTTGFAEAAILHDGEVKAATNLVTKPYRRVDLATKIRAALDAKTSPDFITAVDN
ncbi:PAS domain-containing protein [Cohaesibacter celericrescens]|uniref:PAS domain-containing protein n=1 Tax=Cohaesibacter celericrescens TaxID=2067669 RepID=UPI0035641878